MSIALRGLKYNHHILHFIHYLDDFFTAGPPHTQTCQHNMNSMTRLCSTLNITIKHEKTEGPSTSITFLGILLDSQAMQASIALDHKMELQLAISNLEGKRTCSKHQLLSLIGKLAFTCKFVLCGV